MANDLTIIMMTPNLVPEGWAAYHKRMLLEAAGDAEIITISAKPLDWGTNLIQEEYGFTNIYRQMLRGARLAQTEWVAMADDDTLYPPEHFSYRPPRPGFFYNLNRWHVFTWSNPPFYFLKQKPGGGLLIGTRELMIQALESRFRRCPGDLPAHLCHELGVLKRSIRHDGVEWAGFYTKPAGVVSFYHDYSIDDANRRHRKYAYPVRAFDIPRWGRAYRLLRKFA